MVLFLFGLTSGATVLTTQYWGKGDKKTIEKILGLGMKAAIIVTAAFAFSYLFMEITQVYLYIMRSVERVIVATVVYLASLICNVIWYSYRSYRWLRNVTREELEMDEKASYM